MPEENTGESRSGKGPINLAHERRRREGPLLPDSEIEVRRIEGSLLASGKALFAPNGLLQTVETIEGDTPDLTEQIQDVIIEGAAIELARAVFGKIGALPSTEMDQKEWGKRLITEERYLHKLIEDRTRVPNRDFYVGPSATFDLVTILEHANGLKGEEGAEYDKKLHRRKAIENLGIKEKDLSTNQKLIEERILKERDYYEDAMDKHLLSHGKKDITIGDSPDYEKAR